MRKTLTLAVLFLAGNMLPAADLDKNSFNLVKVNKSDFLLIEKKSPEIPLPKKVEDKVEPRPKTDGPKIEPRPVPKAVEEPEKTDIYKDSSGNTRRRATDGGDDWYWSNNSGRFWWRTNGPRTPFQSAPQSYQSVPQPYCPPGK